MSNQLMLDVDQAGELKAGFRRSGWTNAEVKRLSEGDNLAQVLLFIRGLAEITIVKFVLTLVADFNPAEFIGQRWAIWKGAVDGEGLEGEEDRDVREDALTEIDLANLVTETCLAEGESFIKGEEKLRRLKEAGQIRLGGRTFLALWQDYQKNKKNSLLERLYKTRDITFLGFFGLVLRGPSGYRYVLYLIRVGGGRWRWDYSWLDVGWDARYLSAGLASSAKALEARSSDLGSLDLDLGTCSP